MVHPWTCDLRSFSLLFIGRHRTITFTASGPCVIFKLVSPLLHPLYLLSTADGKKQKFKTEISCGDFFSGKISFHVLLWELNLSVDKNKFPSETSFFYWIWHGIYVRHVYTTENCRARNWFKWKGSVFPILLWVVGGVKNYYRNCRIGEYFFCLPLMIKHKICCNSATVRWYI